MERRRLLQYSAWMAGAALLPQPLMAAATPMKLFRWREIGSLPPAPSTTPQLAIRRFAASAEAQWWPSVEEFSLTLSQPHPGSRERMLWRMQRQPVMNLGRESIQKVRCGETLSVQMSYRPVAPQSPPEHAELRLKRGHIYLLSATEAGDTCLTTSTDTASACWHPNTPGSGDLGDGLCITLT